MCFQTKTKYEAHMRMIKDGSVVAMESWKGVMRKLLPCYSSLVLQRKKRGRVRNHVRSFIHSLSLSHSFQGQISLSLSLSLSPSWACPANYVVQFQNHFHEIYDLRYTKFAEKVETNQIRTCEVSSWWWWCSKCTSMVGWLTNFVFPPQNPDSLVWEVWQNHRFQGFILVVSVGRPHLGWATTDRVGRAIIDRFFSHAFFIIQIGRCRSRVPSNERPALSMAMIQSPGLFMI